MAIKGYDGEIAAQTDKPRGVDREQQLIEIMNEVHAVTAFICEFGSICLGTPQSHALIKTVRKLKELTGKEPAVPNEWPWPGNELGWSPTLPYKEG
jgi:hypothetical protein